MSGVRTFRLHECKQENKVKSAADGQVFFCLRPLSEPCIKKLHWGRSIVCRQSPAIEGIMKDKEPKNE